MDGSVSTAWPPVSPSLPISRIGQKREIGFHGIPEACSALSSKWGERGGQWGEEWSAGRGVSTGQFLHLRQGPLFFERYSSRRRLRRRCCHRRRCLRPLKRFLKKRGERRRRGGPRDANFLSFYFILFYFIFSLSLSFLLPLSFSLSLLTVNGGDSR